MSRTAVVTIVHAREGHLANQRASLARGSREPDDHVVVAMSDRSFPADAHVEADALGLPLAASRNHGARLALDRGADHLVFLDVDCLAGTDLVAAYTDILQDEPDVVWSGPVTYLKPPPPRGYDITTLDAVDSPHPARPAPKPGELVRDADPNLFWSLSFACSAATWGRSGGFCERYVGYGGEDTDFGRILAHQGIGLAWVGAARAYHQWHQVSRPPVEHVDEIVRNAEVFRSRWHETPMLGWLKAFEQRGLVRRDGACYRRLTS
jgi:N-acetylglucosaminyl-diphospho-decaprenol L-rhamnosyltransferase